MLINVYLLTSDLQPSAQASVAGPSAGQQLRQLLKESLQVLQDQGAVYRKVKSQDELYHVGDSDYGDLERDACC